MSGDIFEEYHRLVKLILAHVPDIRESSIFPHVEKNSFVAGLNWNAKGMLIEFRCDPKFSEDIARALQQSNATTPVYVTPLEPQAPQTAVTRESEEPPSYEIIPGQDLPKELTTELDTLTP